MPTRPKHQDSRAAQAEMFAVDATQPDAASRAHKQIDGSIIVEPLGKGVRVTGRDASGSVLWGFVATRTMLEQPHGAIAIYGRLRELLNESLAVLGHPTDRPEDIIAAAETEVGEIERLAANLRKKIAVAKGKKPTNGQLEKAHDIYRAAHDVFLWISHETSIGRPSEENQNGDTDDGDAAQ